MKKLISLLLSLVLVLSVAGAYAGGEEYGEHLDISIMGNAISKKLPEDDAYVIQKVNEMFNVTIHSIQVVNNIADQVTPMYASQDIPDAMLIASSFIDTVLEQELTREIPMSMLAEYAPHLLEQIEINYPNLRKTSVYNAENDSLYAFPSGQGEFYTLFGIRADWLDKVGATMPTNLDEFKELCRKFTEEDPDGNGVNDTWGFAIANSSYRSVSPLAAVFGITLPDASSANPNNAWYISDDQTSAYKAQISPEFKELIEYLADLYKCGYVYPDLSLNLTQTNTLFSEGKIGIISLQTVDAMTLYQPENYVSMCLKMNENARVEVCPPLEGAIYEKQTAPWRYHGFGYDCSDEKMIRVLQIFEKSLTDDVFNALLWRGEEGIHFNYVDGMAKLSSDYSTADAQVSAALKWLFVNFRTDEQKLLTFGPQYYELLPYQAMCTVRNELIPSGVPHPVMDEYKTDLSTLETQLFYNCIAGITDINAEWDNYLAQWNAAGGQATCEEVFQLWKDMQ